MSRTARDSVSTCWIGGERIFRFPILLIPQVCTSPQVLTWRGLIVRSSTLKMESGIEEIRTQNALFHTFREGMLESQSQRFGVVIQLFANGVEGHPRNYFIGHVFLWTDQHSEPARFFSLAAPV